MHISGNFKCTLKADHILEFTGLAYFDSMVSFIIFLKLFSKFNGLIKKLIPGLSGYEPNITGFL